MPESLLLTAAQIITFEGTRSLTNASGFFFERDDRLFLVTSRHVLIDEPSKHFPDRIEIGLHVDPGNMADTAGFSILLYEDKKSVWRQGKDSAGEIDVAVLEIERDALPETATFYAFTPAHLTDESDEIEVGTSLLILGFPLGFHDTLHLLPIVRHAIVASTFSLRFQGNGYFLTDARTHRGSSGAPVVMRVPEPGKELEELPWMLLGVHSARLDIATRSEEVDEALGLNCAWFADILMILTRD